MDFNTGLNSHATKLILLTPVPANKIVFFVYSTVRNAPYVHTTIDSILELCQTS